MTVTFRDLADAQHGKSKAVRSLAEFDRPRCPECGSSFVIDETVKETAEGIVQIVRAAFCSGCEFVHEF